MRKVTLLAFGAIGPLFWACNEPISNPRAEEAISQDRLIEALHLLRREALRSPEAQITLEDRDRVLTDLGLKEEDLLNFVDVWGEDGGVMQTVWEGVDSLLREDRIAGRGRDTEEEEEDDPGGSDPGARGGVAP